MLLLPSSLVSPTPISQSACLFSSESFQILLILPIRPTLQSRTSPIHNFSVIQLEANSRSSTHHILCQQQVRHLPQQSKSFNSLLAITACADACVSAHHIQCQELAHHLLQPCRGSLPLQALITCTDRSSLLRLSSYCCAWSSDPQILRSSDSQILRFSDPQVLKSSDPQILRFPDPQILKSSDSKKKHNNATSLAFEDDFYSR